MPEWCRKVSPRLRPAHPPVFPDGEPTPQDRELALELWRALDVESRRWYTYDGTARTFAGLPLTAEDIAGLSGT